jgi:ABC-type branched-subunit amino acid transport system ATPase component
LADLCFVLRTGEIVFAGEPGELDTDAIARSYLGGDSVVVGAR